MQSIHFRAFAAVFAAWLALSGMSAVAQDSPARTLKTNEDIFAGTTDDLSALALRAYVWGYPLVRAAQVRLKTTNPDAPYVARPPTVPGAAINSIGHQRALSSPETRLGVAPNNDTLYSLAWLDLANEPYVMETPDFGDRYYTFQIGQADTATYFSPGRRTHGSQLPPVFLYGPDYRGPVPAGMLAAQSAQRYLMIAGRILVNGPDDLPAVHALQAKIQLRPWHRYAQQLPATSEAVPQRPLARAGDNPASPFAFLEALGAVLQDWHVQDADRSVLASLGRLGLSPESGFVPGAWTPAEQEAIAKGLAEGDAAVRAKTYRLGRLANGWSINDAGPHFGTDYLLRAAVAMDQIYVLEPQEALYPSARVDHLGKPLDGTHAYRIRFNKQDLPPVHAFWSITLYYAKGFMVPNAMDRWSIGDRTPGLVYGDDGSLELYVQYERPAGAKAANWLPAPREPFMLLMRLYIPKTDILEGRWVPPPVENLGTAP